MFRYSHPKWFNIIIEWAGPMPFKNIDDVKNVLNSNDLPAYS